MPRIVPELRRSSRNKSPASLRLVGARLTGAFLLTLLAGCHRGDDPSPSTQRIGVSTSLPILWGESDDPRELLSSGAPRSWAGDLLASLGKLQPLDSLTDAQGRLPLPIDALLVMAQPRALTPQENVALDNWVRAGGRLLLFVDPMLTQPSRYPLGDPRRPQAIAMLSPILAHWGLELRFARSEKPEERSIPLRDGSLPVNLPGRFHLLGISGDADADRGDRGIAGQSAASGKSREGNASCSLESAKILANCRIGRGRVLAVADAALFEDAVDPADLSMRQKALNGLLFRLKSGD